MAKDERIEFERVSLDGRYHQCWYPIARSHEIERGCIVGRDVLGGRVIVYRTSDDAVHIMSARCRHLGADLGLGALVGDNVRCPFHHWQYGLSGECAEIPAGDRIPSRAQLMVYPAEEKWGLVWMFNGSEPSYPVPSFGEWNPDTMVSRAYEVELDSPMDCDPWILGSNAFDFQHLRALHGMTFEARDVQIKGHSMEYHSEDETPGAGAFSMHMTMWGTNCIVADAVHDGRMASHIAAGTPMGSAGTRFWLVTATTIDPEDPSSLNEAGAVLDMLATVNTRIINEDLPILNSIRPSPQVLVTSDRALAQYFQYAKKYPKVRLIDLEIDAVAARLLGRNEEDAFDEAATAGRAN